MLKIKLLVLIAALSVGNATYAQFGKELGKAVENAAKKTVKRKAEQKTEKAVGKAIDKATDADTYKEDAKDKTEKTVENQTIQQEEVIEDTGVTEEQEQDQPQLNWAKYDFVPGSEIIFEDNQEGEQNGEFPSKWDLISGTVENARFGENNVIYFLETGNFPNGIVPLLKETSADYLPDEFTVEFDAYFEKGKNNDYRVYFYDAKNKLQKNIKNAFVSFYVNQAKYGNTGTEKQLEGTQFGNKDNEYSHWRHIAISFNKRAMKVYMDDTRLLNIPNITDNLTGISLSVNHAKQTNNQFIKNVRIAKGAVPLYDKLLTDGKFITTGIKFDVNKATIKPESMGTIYYVVKMMTDHPDLNFSVEGHTDSDGDEASNQTLSEARAKAVMDKMIELGISSGRLSSKGHGEIRPMTGNDTAEGKAQNRRVEFVKQ